MAGVQVILDGDGCWEDLKDREVGRHVEPNLVSRKRPYVLFELGPNSPPVQMAMLRQGTVGGLPAVAIRLDLPDGNTVVAHLTLRELVGAVNLFQVKAGMG